MIILPWIFIFAWLVTVGSTSICAQDAKDLRHKVSSPTFEGDQAREREYYEIEKIPTPAGVVFEAAGMDLLPGGRLAISTRLGEIWLVDGAFAPDVSKVKFTLFTTGLHHPLSIFWRDGWFYVTEVAGITRLRDTNGDDRSDEAEVVSAKWGLSGDSLEYSFSSRPDRDGNVWTALALTAALSSDAPWRGWVVRTTPDGQMIPTVAGIRSPGGVGFNPAGDCFATDNQGYWVGSSCLRHLKPGTYHGALPALEFWELTKGAWGPKPKPPKTGRPLSDHLAEPRYLPPAVIFPHMRLGRSPTGFDFDQTGEFGPFQGQLIVAEHTLSLLQRVDLEKVDGLYQGAVFPFFYGLESGPISLRFGPGGRLILCGSDRIWGSRGGKPFHFDRLRWKGQMPFEVQTMRVWSGGFDFTFTEEVEPSVAGSISSYSVEAWTYLQSTQLREYGSPELDKLQPKVTAAEVSPDGRKVRLTITPMTPGHVHEVRLPGIRNRKGETIVHPIAWYTLNALPGGSAKVAR